MQKAMLGEGGLGKADGRETEWLGNETYSLFVLEGCTLISLSSPGLPPLPSGFQYMEGLVAVCSFMLYL